MGAGVSLCVRRKRFLHCQGLRIKTSEVIIAIRFALWVGDIRNIRFWKFYHEQP